MKELDVVALTRNFPEFGLRAGVFGTIVHEHRTGGAVMVEFNETEDGPVESLPRDALRLATAAELDALREKPVAAE